MDDWDGLDRPGIITAFAALILALFGWLADTPTPPDHVAHVQPQFVMDSGS